MAKNKYLNSTEKGQIDILKANGLSNREIARQINRSEKVIRNYIRLGAKYGSSSKKNKRNTKVNRRQISYIKECATKNRRTSSQIVAELQLPIGKRRVQQILATDKSIKWKKMAKKPALTPKHKAARLEFSKRHMAWVEHSTDISTRNITHRNCDHWQHH